MNTPRRILVLANETCAGVAVCDEVRYRAGGAPATVLVVAPALARSRLGHWLAADLERSRADARERLDGSVRALRGAGLEASGQLGDADPLQALDDAYRVFAPDEIVVSTHPPARSNWLERRVVQQARELYPVPVTHVVVDLIHEAAATHADPRPAPAAARQTITLYRALGYTEALGVTRAGFANERDDEGRSGVAFVDSPEHAESGSGDATVFTVEVPVKDAELYEAGTDGGVRRFVLPAELVNRHGPRALATDWSE